MKKDQKEPGKPKKEENQNIDEEDEKEDLTNDKNKNEDLYSLLGIKKTANNPEIRKAYRRLVFLFHPDKNKTDPDASSKFSNISKAYKILSNPETKKIYDDTGEYDEENQGEINITETLNYFRKIYSPQDIESFEKKYVGSKEEEEDLINFYNENDGDMKHILEWIPFSKNEDIERYIKIYENLFKNKNLKKNKKYEDSKDNIKLIKEDPDETKEANEELDKLTKQIMERKRKRDFNEYLDNLKNKYAKDEEDIGEIDEEEFQKIYKTLNKKGKKKSKK
jgi:DnaJ family protein C protein 9